ncbi:MAG: N-acetyltransferase family protein, partial [Pseudomonadota bacterium]
IPSRSDVEAAITAANAAQDPYIVAVSEAVVCGFARLTTFRSGSGYAKTKELTIHLHPTARGQGLGRRLLDALEEHARATNVATLVAGISATNSTALNFHTKLGYVECGRIARAGFKFDHHIDLVLMQKIL